MQVSLFRLLGSARAPNGAPRPAQRQATCRSAGRQPPRRASTGFTAPGNDADHVGAVQNVAMKSLTAGIRFSFAALLLAAAGTVGAQNIYKCTQGGHVAYTDHPCADGKGELLHRADDTEIIDRYLRLGQDNLAKKYADANHLEALYQQRLDARQQARDEAARRQDDEAYAAEQRAAEAQQQSLADQAAERDRLQAENEALRQQNEHYQDQLAQPVYDAPPVYWNTPPPYSGHHGGHRPPPSKEPVFHPCKQLAGGRVQC
jgi:hypothetical protein